LLPGRQRIDVRIDARIDDVRHEVLLLAAVVSRATWRLPELISPLR
jgi:hypothetical protein